MNNLTPDEKAEVMASLRDYVTRPDYYRGTVGEAEKKVKFKKLCKKIYERDIQSKIQVWRISPYF